MPIPHTSTMNHISQVNRCLRSGMWNEGWAKGHSQLKMSLFINFLAKLKGTVIDLTHSQKQQLSSAIAVPEDITIL